MGKLRVVLLLALPLLLGGCPKKEEKAGPEKAAVEVPPAKGQAGARPDASSASPLLGKLLGRKGPAEAPEGTPSTLKEAVQGFTGYEDCLQRVELALPADLGQDLLSTVDIPDGLCRTREALAREQVRACDRMSSYSMRKGCRTMYAVYHNSPDDCRSGSPSYFGRDVYCLALSSRDPRLCRAVRRERQEVRCRAILAQDEQMCEDLTRHAWRKACKAEVQRWKGSMAAGPKVPAEAVPASMTVTISREGSGSSGGGTLPQGEVKVECANVGALVPSTGDTAHVVLCDYASYYLRYRRSRGGSSASRRKAVQVRLSFKPTSDLSQTLRFGVDANFALKLERSREYRQAQTGELHLTSFERRRGGRVAGKFKVTVGRLRDEVTVQGTFETFVRDLVEPRRLRRFKVVQKRYGALGSRGRSSIRSLLRRRRSGSGSTGLLGALRGLGKAPAERDPSKGKRFAALYSAAQITPRKVGSQSGLYFTRIRRDCIWSRLGLKDGDVMLSFDGSPTRKRRDISRIRTRLRAASRVVIKLSRKGKPSTVEASAVTLNGIRQEFSL